MTLIRSLLFVNVQWLAMTYEIQCKTPRLELSVSALIVLRLPVRALRSSQTGLLPDACAHVTFSHHSIFTNDLPLMFSLPPPKLSFKSNSLSFFHVVIYSVVSIQQTFIKCPSIVGYHL